MVVLYLSRLRSSSSSVVEAVASVGTVAAAAVAAAGLKTTKLGTTSQGGISGRQHQKARSCSPLLDRFAPL